MANLGDVTQKEAEFGDLFKRMDEDKDLYYLKKYVLVDKKNNKVDGIFNVTLNLPATFAAHVQSALMSATQQAVVTGHGLSDDVTAGVETFLKAAFADADRRQRLIGEPAVRAFVTEQLNLRGRAAARVLCYKGERGETVIDIMPLDTRYFTYEMGKDGMEWGAYRTFRSPAAVSQEYPEYSVGRLAGLVNRIRGIGGVNRGIEVIDLWDREVNQVYIQGQKVREVSHPYGRPPFPFQQVPLGSMLKDSDAFKHQGESIFFLIRDLIPELNRLASILQTLNMASVKGAKLWFSQGGTEAKPPTDADEMGTTTSADIGGGMALVPQGDIKAAGKLMHSMLTRMIEAGSLSLTDYGNLQFPLSAVALVELGESSNQVFLPRLGAKGLLFQQMAEMLIEQVLNLGLSTIELGARGHRQKFAVSDLKGDYDIEYQYFVKSPQTDVARYAIADVARQFLDDDTILRDVMQVENPTEIRLKRRYDEAEELSPAIKLYRTAVDLLKLGKKLEAKIIADEIGLTLEQITTGEMSPKPSRNGKGKQPARNILPPLMGSRAGSNKLASQMSGEMEPSAGEEA